MVQVKLKLHLFRMGNITASKKRE